MFLSNLFSFLFTFVSLVLGLSDPAPSPKASTDLICHTNHASECYPSIFQPTEHFQIVHDDQSLPPGLHVRINLATGLKEARLNVPEPEAPYSDLVIIDEPETRREQAVLEEEQQPRVRPPRYDADEETLFHNSISIVKSPSSSSEALEPALSDLQDLAHSQDWGLTLTKDRVITHFLTKTLQDISAKLALRSLCALVLATAIQNNPEALSAALSHFYNDELSTSGPLDAVILALLHEQCPLLLTRVVFLLSALCQDPEQLEAFVEKDGLGILLKLFNVSNIGQDDHDKLRSRIANFVLDHLYQFDGVVAKSAEQRVMYETLEGNELRDGNDGEWVIVGDINHEPTIVEESSFDGATLDKVLREWRDVFGKGIETLRSTDRGSNHATLDSLREAHEAIANRLAKP